MRAQSWQEHDGSGGGSTDGDGGKWASAAQDSADMSRRWEGEQAQRDWTSPAVAVAPDTGLIEVRLCVSFRTGDGPTPALYV